MMRVTRHDSARAYPQRGTLAPSRSRIRRAAIGAVGAAAAVVSLCVASPAAAATPGPVGGAQWLLGQSRPDGALPNYSNTGPDYAATAQLLIGLADVGASAAEMAPALTWLRGNVVSAASNPGRLAFTILAARAAGDDPRAFAGHDLVAELLATKQASGLFGSSDATFDGAYRQGMALYAIAAVDPALAPADAVGWLVGQQCANGLWTAFRADVTVPCPAADPIGFTGPDSNSSAAAVLALTKLGVDPAVDAVAALLATRDTDGGWAYIVGTDATAQASDANSTALVLAALGASAPAEARAYLLSLQIPCDSSNAGAFSYQTQYPGANLIATVQAVPALSGGFAPTGPGTGLAGDPCRPATTTSSTSSAATTSSSNSATTTVSVASTVSPSVATSAPSTTTSLYSEPSTADFGWGGSPAQQRTSVALAAPAPIAPPAVVRSATPAFTGARLDAGFVGLAALGLGMSAVVLTRRAGRRSHS